LHSIPESFSLQQKTPARFQSVEEMLSTPQTPRSTFSRISPLWMIVLAWAASNALLLALQALRLGVGFHVHPLGEDRVWTHWMVNNPGFALDRQFWQNQSRNPLAPWWYQAFSPLIFLLPEGLYLVRKLVDLFLAVSVYLLINEICRGKLPKLAFGCGVLVLLWNFSAYQEQILWTMLISFGFSILSAYFYCRYLDSAKAAGEYFAVSLLLFFVALATYSIQSGVPGAVLLLGLFRPREKTGNLGLSYAAAVGAARDAILFFALFLLYLQVWITTSGPTSTAFHLDPTLFLKQFLASITSFLWHSDTTALMGSLNEHWPLWLVVASFSVNAILFYCLFVSIAGKEATPPTAGSSAPILDLILTLAVFSALVAPTVLLESTSSVWYPGSRSRMVLQVFQPVAYLLVLFILADWLFRRKRRAYPQNAGMALLCAMAAILGLEYNRELSEQTSFERKLETALKKIVPVLVKKPIHFVVKMKGMKRGVWYSGIGREMPSLFVQMAYKSDAVTLDPVYEGDPRAVSETVTFGSDQSGMYSPESASWVPYQQVVVVEFDGQRATQMTRIGRETVSGYQVRYDRESELVQDSKAVIGCPDCPTSFDFRSAPDGAGWSAPEQNNLGEWYTWMASTKASLKMSTSCAGAARLKIRVLAPMAPDILQSLRIAANGLNIPVEIFAGANDGLFDLLGAIPASAMRRDGALMFDFTVDRTVVPEGGNRTLAIPFASLAIDQN
jgi:hypothetical protein